MRTDSSSNSSNRRTKKRRSNAPQTFCPRETKSLWASPLSLLRRALLSCLLVSVVIPVLGTSSFIGSQGLTTLTSLQTVTSSSTSTSLLPLQYIQLPEDYDKATGRFHLMNERELIPIAISMREGEPIEPLICGFYDYFTINGLSSEEIRGQLTSEPYPVAFHIMTRQQFDYWTSRQFWSCGPPVAFLNGAGSSYSFDWTVPENREYVFLFDSRWNGGEWPNSITVHFSANIVSSSTLIYQATSTLTGSAAVTTAVGTSTPTSSSPQSSQAVPSLGSQNVLLVAVATLAVAFLVFVAWRKLGK